MLKLAAGLVLGLVIAFTGVVGAHAAPEPLIAKGKPADWLFVYKFNAWTAPTAPSDPRRKCTFGGDVHKFTKVGDFSHAYAFASSASPSLKLGSGLLGVTDQDPLGATFAAIFNGNLSYVVYNDQFEDAPPISGCGAFCADPWAHAKGVIAWDDQGNGILLQVTTPSWPGAGGAGSPRKGDGNTLGCTGRNNLLYAQHFFALKLSPNDTAVVLQAAYNAGVPTRTDMDQVFHLQPAGPDALAQIARRFGDNTPAGAKAYAARLDSGVQLISKPAVLHVPPWQMVSAMLGGEPLRVASWITGDVGLPSTVAGKPGCWDPSLGAPARVEIALTGTWNGKPIALNGGRGPIGGNHAKIGVSLAGGHDYAIFGDMNQTGGLLSHCDKSQNPRGGLFFAVQDSALAGSVRALLQGHTAADGDRTVDEGAVKWATPARRRR